MVLMSADCAESFMLLASAYFQNEQLSPPAGAESSMHAGAPSNMPKIQKTSDRFKKTF